VLKYHTGDDELPEALYSTILQKYCVFCDIEVIVTELLTVEGYPFWILAVVSLFATNDESLLK